MKAGWQPTARARAKLAIPRAAARSRYRMSISCSVSRCSPVKETGTTTTARWPAAAKLSSAASVVGASQGCRPTRLWKASCDRRSRPSRWVTAATVERMSSR